MAGRLKKTHVDYFPHYCNQGNTLYIVENRFGNDGYAFWFKLLELLGKSDRHHYICGNPESWQYLLATTRVSEDIANQILNLLSQLQAIDTELWEKYKVIWSDNFVDNIADVYSRRANMLPTRLDIISIYANKNNKNDNKNVKSVNKNRETKLNKTKVYMDSFMYAEIVSDFNVVTNSHFRTDPVTKDIVELINARIKEGFAVEDFKKVHRVKKATWGPDPKMSKYLRPHTLYTAKFQAYLNEKVEIEEPEDEISVEERETAEKKAIKELFPLKEINEEL